MRRLAIYLPHPLPIWRLPQGYIEKIRRSAGKRFDLDLPANEAGLVKVLPEIEVLYAWGLAQRLVSQAAKMRWIHTPLTGVDRLLNPDLRATDIRVTCSRGVNSVAVAEHTFAMVMALTRGIAEAAQAQSHRHWRQAEMYGRKPPLVELKGKTLGIYGVGEIGRELATRAQAFGMKVWAVARTTKTAPFGVDKLLGNIGRGGLVQEPALVRALREGWIGGACLDVFGTEPLSPTNPLWGMPNVVLTPHVAGLHPDYMARSADIFLDNLKRYLAGKPLLNEVDLQAGY
jgi:phosphoglycerate dehydrogenase-like enzyme